MIVSDAWGQIYGAIVTAASDSTGCLVRLRLGVNDGVNML